MSRDVRNLLVHEHGRVDDALIFETIDQRLGDFDTFSAEILAFPRYTIGQG